MKYSFFFISELQKQLNKFEKHEIMDFETIRPFLVYNKKYQKNKNDITQIN